MTTNEATDFNGLTRSRGRSVFVDDGIHDTLPFGREMVLNHGLLPLAFGFRLATTTLVAELASADVRASAMNGTANVVVLAFRGACVAGAPLTVVVPDHSRSTVLAPFRGRDDGLLAVHLGLADEDETAGSEVAGVADATDLV